MNERVEQAERLSAGCEGSSPFKTLKQNESCSRQFAVLFPELGNDNNGTGDEENSSDPSNLDSLLSQ
jgi:hypothetical protein